MKTSKNGYHAKYEKFREVATSIDREVRIVWRTQKIECCGNSFVFNDDNVPYWIDQNQHNNLNDRTFQCSNCGRVYVGNYKFKYLK